MFPCPLCIPYPFIRFIAIKFGSDRLELGEGDIGYILSRIKVNKRFTPGGSQTG